MELQVASLAFQVFSECLDFSQNNLNEMVPPFIVTMQWPQRSSKLGMQEWNEKGIALEVLQSIGKDL